MIVRHLSAIAALVTAAAAPLGAHAASGLSGAYYVVSGPPGTLAVALSDIASLSPTATFTSTSVCFPSCGTTIGDGGSTIADFLGGNATGLTANSVTDLSSHVVVLTGFVAAAAPGPEDFTLESDDGSELIINGVQVIDDDGDHGFGGSTTTVDLNPGLNSIEIVQFEDGGVTGLTVLENGAALTGQTAGVPEPAAWALMLAGFGGLGLAMRSRRKQGLSPAI
jgi:hypothetical protein